MKDIKKSQQVEDKREKEKQIVDLMIHLYCRKKHKTVEKHHGLCEECEKLRDYAAMRVDKCPFMETKWRQRHSAVTAGYIVTSRR